MTAKERAEMWERFCDDAYNAEDSGSEACTAFFSGWHDNAFRWGRNAAHHASLAIDAYEALRADDAPDEVRFWQTEAVNARVEGAVLIAEASTMPRCGTCRWWEREVDPDPHKVFRSCLNRDSECRGQGWSASHGCPQHEVQS